MKPKKYRSVALSAIHESMTALHDAGVVASRPCVNLMPLAGHRCSR